MDGVKIAEFSFKAAGLMLLLFASVQDLKNKKISLSLVVTVGMLSLFYGIFESIWSSADKAEMLYGILPGIVVIALSFITKNGIGLGDGLMILALGPMVGAKGMTIAVMTACLLSAACCMIMLVFKRITLKGSLAFLPFLTAGMGVIYFAT